MKRKFIIFCCLFFHLHSGATFAATLVVGSDGTDKLGSIPDGDVDGVCQLREAIVNANDNAATYADCDPGVDDTDIIELQDGVTYALELQGSEEDDSLTGDLDISEGLTLTSNGESTIDASTLTILSEPDRILHYSGTETLTLSHVVFQGGQIDAVLADNYGSVLYVSDEADVVIDDCEFSENTIDLSGNNTIYGGVIGSDTLNNLTITDSSFHDNLSIEGEGAATVVFGGVLYLWNFNLATIERTEFLNNTIENYATLAGGILNFNSNTPTSRATLSDTTFSQNSITSHNVGVDFGGVLKSDNCSLEITKSVFDHNTMANPEGGSEIGGVLYFTSDFFETENFVLLNSTINNNTLTSDAGTAHGTIYVTGIETAAHISFSTIAANTVGDSNTTSAAGGGFYIELETGSDTIFEFKSNVLSNNLATQTSGAGSGQNCSIDGDELLVVSEGFNVFSVLTGCSIDFTDDDIIGDPELQTFDDWGGATQSFSILDTSPAHNVDSSCLDAQNDIIDSDQRGAPRFDGLCDAGAYEHALYYTDADADLFGDDQDSGTIFYDVASSVNNEDCNDADANFSPDDDELCDELDNDCDGDSDEDFSADLGVVCTVGDGECQASGVLICSEDLTSVACSVSAGSPTAEICDELDNDCDFETDEDFADLGESCTFTSGSCEAEGVMDCTDDGATTECRATTTEVCDDLLDNDCDGTTDAADSECSAGDDDTTGDDDSDSGDDDASAAASGCQLSASAGLDSNEHVLQAAILVILMLRILTKNKVFLL